MTKTKTTPPIETPAAPEFDRLKAIQVEPRRHEATARTVGHVQPDGAQAHLFSYAGDFIATVSATKAKPFLPPPAPKAKADAAANAFTDPLPAPGAPAAPAAS